MILYQNGLYKVFHRHGSPEYLVVNKMTNVIEDRTNKLPTAVGSAIALQAALDKLLEKEKSRQEEAHAEQNSAF